MAFKLHVLSLSVCEMRTDGARAERAYISVMTDRQKNVYQHTIC